MMIQKSEAVVLHTLRYQDSSLIATMYVRESGVMKFLIPGVYSARNRGRHAFYQPLALLEIVYYVRETRELQKLTESSLACYYQSLTLDPVKIVYATLLAEVFHKAVREEIPNPELYDRFRETLIRMDRARGGLFELVFTFFWELTGFLGFQPQLGEDMPGPGVYFDMQEGGFVPVAFGPEDASANQLDGYLLEFLRSIWSGENTQAPARRIPERARTPLLEKTFRYYAYHLEHFRSVASLDIFRQVFQ